MPSTSKIKRYGLSWDTTHFDDLQIEHFMLRKGGQWTNESGKTFGNGNYFHFKQAFRLCWPEDDEHRWEDESLKAICSNQFTTLMGCASSTKTTIAAKWAITFYGVFPKGTTILISSTDMRGLELRVWGRIKELLERAKNRYDWFPGHILDSKKGVATDDVEDTGVRDLRHGIICIPCLSSSGQFVGLGKYIGIHNERVIFIGDEFQLMRETIMQAVPNLINNKFSKFMFLGNPLAQGDPLDFVSEPKDGWSSVGIPTKTTSWRTRYMDGVCLNLVGTDSPNFDYPADQPDRFSFMIGRAKMKLIRDSYGESSSEFCSQCLGIRVSGLTARKVITREICDKFGAFDKVIWAGTPTVKIYAVDAAYGNIGGDRCWGGWIEFGKAIDGNIVLNVGLNKLIPVSALSNTPPDDQIAEFVKQDCEAENIPPENVFFDGRTLLATAFARIWSSQVNPVDFGGRTTERPVSLDMYIYDEIIRAKRLKRCNEHYSKFVTELYFSVRYAIESKQFRGMTDDILNDGQPREWKTVRGNMVEIEAKHEMKKRTGRSPDIFDWLVTAVEGARRRGFEISKLASEESLDNNWRWFRDLQTKQREKREAYSLSFS